MVSGCGTALAKILLFIVNFAVWLASLGLMAIGIWMLVESSRFETIFAEENMLPIAVMFLVLGVLTFIVGFSGCCGAIKDSVCLLVLYFLLMLLIIAGEITVGVLVFINKDDVQESMEKGMKLTIKEQYGMTTAATDAVDFVQKTFDCCGATSYENYADSAFQNQSGRPDALPDSCCRPDTEPDTCSYTSGDELQSEGCVDKTSQAIEDNALLIGLVSLGFIIVQVFAMIISCCLISAVRKDTKYEAV